MVQGEIGVPDEGCRLFKPRGCCAVRSLFQTVSLRFFYTMPLACLLVFVRANADVLNANIVGYQTITLKCGDNTYPLPKTIADNPHRLKDYLSQLLDGDRVLVEGPLHDQVWAEVIEYGDGKHAYPEHYDGLADDWELPSLGGVQMLKVRRERRDCSSVSVAGEFQSDVPLQFKTYSTEIPLPKVKLTPTTVESLQTVITNSGNISTPTTVSKLFEIVLRNGRRIKAKVDQRTRVLVDAMTNEPINVDVGEIDYFSEINDARVPNAEKVERAQLQKIVTEIKKEADDFDRKKMFRDALFGALWNSDHWPSMVGVWLLTLGVLAFVNKFWNMFWDWFFSLVSCKIRKTLRRIIEVGKPGRQSPCIRKESRRKKRWHRKTSFHEEARRRL